MGNATEVEQYPYCFGCGSENPFGLRLSFDMDDGKLSAEFTAVRAPSGLARRGAWGDHLLASL